jgi:hypothetical protein
MSLQRVYVRNRAEDVASLIALVERSPRALQVMALTLYDRRLPIQSVDRLGPLFTALHSALRLTLRLDPLNLPEYLLLLTYGTPRKLLPQLSQLTLEVKQCHNYATSLTAEDWSTIYAQVHALVKSRCGTTPLSEFKLSVALLTPHYFTPPKDLLADLLPSGLSISVSDSEIVTHLWYSDDSDGNYR